jgi:hypothetical protein
LIHTRADVQSARIFCAGQKFMKLLRGLVGMLFGVFFTFILIEVFLRVGFDALPPGVQAEIQAVRRVPWSEERIIPYFPYIIDRDFQARIPPDLRSYPIRWSDARFDFDTRPIWEGHRAGLRTAPPVYPLDIMTFGDSFTFCWTASADCWVDMLAAQGWHVVNAGNSGTGPGGQLNLMREIIEPTKPALIIWQWYTNDISDDYDLARIRGEVDELPPFAPMPDAPPAPQGLGQYSAVWHLVSLRLNPAARTSPYQHYQPVVLNGRPVSVHTDEYPHLHSLEYPSAEYGFERNLENHREGHALAERLGAEIVLVLIPSKEEAYASLLTNNLSEEYLTQLRKPRERLLAQCIEQGWHCVDPLPAFQEAIANGQTVYYAFDSHLDPSGNRIIADLVMQTITENNLIPTR